MQKPYNKSITKTAFRNTVNLSGMHMATRTQVLTLVAIMATLANVLSVPPIAVPITLGITVHFTQLPIYLAALLAGPAAGLITGAVGGLYMSFTKIPFIVGGLGLLGFVTGGLRKRFRPFIAGVLAWVVQAPYVVVTDFVWFSVFVKMSAQAAWALILQLIITLTIEAVISSALAEIIVSYLSRARIIQQTLQRQQKLQNSHVAPQQHSVS